VGIQVDNVAAALPSYEIGEELGRGSSGVVLAARHRQLARDVAIKLLPPDLAEDTEVRRRFLSEAKLLASFSHVHILPVFDFVEHEGLCALVLERVDGGTLQSHGRAGIDALASCAAVLALSSALQYAHERGVLHRDVKPGNVLIAADGMVKVADFGIAKVLGGTDTLATRTGFVLGTPAYMAPEQADGSDLGPGTDVYGAGTVLYELLCGHLPFDTGGNPLQMLYTRVHTDPTPLRRHAPGIPAELAGVVMRALARDPVERYRSANDFGIALARAAANSWEPDWLSQAPFAFAGAGAILTAVRDDARTAHPAHVPVIEQTISDFPAEPTEIPAGELVPVSRLLAGEGAGAPPAQPPAASPAGEAAPEPTAATAAVEPAATAPAPRASRTRLALAGGLLAVLAAIAVVAVLLSGGDSSKPAPKVAARPLGPLARNALPDALFPQQQIQGTVLGTTAWLLGGLTGGPGDAKPTARVQTFDTAINRWSAGPSLPEPLHHAMAVAYHGHVMILGGWLAKGANLTATTTKNVYELEGSTWVKLAPMRTPRAAGVAVVADDKIVVTGGLADNQLVTTTDVFDGHKWVRGADIPTPREHLAGAGDGRYVYTVGGVALGQDLTALERYDPRNDTWKRLPSMKVARNGLGAAIIDGRLFAVGGENASEVLADVEVYDIAAQHWAKSTPMSRPRHGMAVVTARPRLFALAGAFKPSHTGTTKTAESLTVPGG
jgi:serine/threonine protein kinase